MIDHVTIATRDVEASKAFYERAFQALGYAVAFGEERVFWAFQLDNNALFEIRAARDNEPAITSTHIALRVKSKDHVDAFYNAALTAGARDNGKPGFRPQYNERYYACFVYDPDAHNIEAMLETD